MGKYTDEETRKFPKITCKISADYLGIQSMAVSIGMRNDLLSIGFAIHNEDRYTARGIGDGIHQDKRSSR